MSVVEERLDAILHDLEDLPAEQWPRYSPTAATLASGFRQALRVFVRGTDHGCRGRAPGR